MLSNLLQGIKRPDLAKEPISVIGFQSICPSQGPHNLPHDSFANWRRHCVPNLLFLLGHVSYEFVLMRETLDTCGLSDGRIAWSTVMDRPMDHLDCFRVARVG